MLEVGSYFWLIAAFAVVPLVRWLHLRNMRANSFIVPSLLLWADHVQARSKEERGRRIDPRWRLRALAACFLGLALAGLSLRSDNSPPITVWFDGSSSLTVVEGGDQRWQQALPELALDLEAAGADRFTVQSLTARGAIKTFSLQDRVEWEKGFSLFVNSTRSRSNLPSPQEFLPTNRHWLISDGADLRLPQWLMSVPMERVYSVGSTTDNVGLTNMAVRRSLSHSDQLTGVVTIDNTSTQLMTRRLSILVNAQNVFGEDVVLAPDKPRVIPFLLPQTGLNTSVFAISAILEPKDPFELDDVIGLNALEMLKPLNVNPPRSCGQHFRLALESNPAFAVTSRDGGITVSCAKTPNPEADLRIWQSPDASTKAVGPVWTKAAGRLAEVDLGPVQLSFVANGGNGDGIPLLRTQEAVLISAGDTHGIDVFVDLQAREMVREAVFPLLVAALVKRAAKREFSEPIAQKSFERSLSDITPRVIPVRPVFPGIKSVGLTPWLVVLALLFMSFDLLLTIQQGRGMGLNPRSTV